MKILHTSDWHLGHTLYNYDRSEEQLAMLQQITDIVRAQCPDVFVLAGDVYHTPQPSAAVQTMFTNALVAIHEACPTMTIVITAGNHDSGAKHDIYRAAWRALGVYTIGSLSKSNPSEHIIAIPGKGYVIAIPYVNERNLPENFFSDLLALVAAQNTDGLPVVLTAHTTVSGCDYTGHEHATDYAVGGIDTFAVEQLGEGYDYLALGHIHRAQFVHTGKHNVRYSGTPLPVSFDETYPHSISMVEIAAHGQTPIVTPVQIANPRPLVTLPTEGTAAWEEAKALLSAFPADIPAYIRLRVAVDTFLPTEAQAEAQQIAEGKQCRFCYIQSVRSETKSAETKTLSLQEFQAEQPIDLAVRYAEDMGVTFDEEMHTLFQETMTLIQNDMRNE